jgi:glutaminase
MQSYLEQAVLLGRRAAKHGRVCTQIPALSTVPHDKFGMAVATVDGYKYAVGDSSELFSIQSLSKLFSLCALLRLDPEAWARVGWEPTDSGYGSVAELERTSGQPRNPFVNPGALVVTDRLISLTGDAVSATADLIRDSAGIGSPIVQSDPRVALSEANTDHRNAAIAHILTANKKLANSIDQVLTQFFAHSAISASVQMLADAALILADRSETPQILDVATVRRVNAVLLMSGMYGAAGETAYKIGLPAKSGIGGGVLAIMPGKGVVCAWSPPLNEVGNSAGGIAAIEEFARLANWSVF